MAIREWTIYVDLISRVWTFLYLSGILLYLYSILKSFRTEFNVSERTTFHQLCCSAVLAVMVIVHLDRITIDNGE